MVKIDKTKAKIITGVDLSSNLNLDIMITHL